MSVFATGGGCGMMRRAVLGTRCVRGICVTVTRMKVPTMKQVEVDEADIQKQLGTLQMDFIKKAEKSNKKRANLHRFFRRKDWMIAAFCFSLVLGIYFYTIFAIKQEKFLDDFDMPDEIDRTKASK